MKHSLSIYESSETLRPVRMNLSVKTIRHDAANVLRLAGLSEWNMDNHGLAVSVVILRVQ